MSFLLFALLLSASLMQGCDSSQTQSPAAETSASPSPSAENNNPLLSTDSLKAGLIRVGDAGIETGDEKVLDAYFTPDFVIHTQSGDLNLAQLKAYWVNLRNALTGFAITREQIITEGNTLAARSTFSGTFDKELTQSRVGPLKPTGQPVKWEVISTFRYNNNGRLAEEWVISDNVGFLKQFGVDVLKTSRQ